MAAAACGGDVQIAPGTGGWELVHNFNVTHDVDR